MYALVLELDMWRLISDMRCVNRVVVWHLHGRLHLVVERGHVLVGLRVRHLHWRHLTPALVLRQSHLVEIRLLLRSDLVLWIGLGLGQSEVWLLD